MMCKEVYVFLGMILCGAVCSVIFDLLRAFRIALNPCNAVVVVTDVLFWSSACFTVTAFVWNLNNGIFRFYEPIGIALGVIFYFLTCSRVFLNLFLFIFENILKILFFIFKILLTPSQFLYKILVVNTADVIRGRKTNKKRKDMNTCD